MEVGALQPEIIIKSLSSHITSCFLVSLYTCSSTFYLTGGCYNFNSFTEQQKADKHDILTRVYIHTYVYVCLMHKMKKKTGVKEFIYLCVRL